MSDLVTYAIHYRDSNKQWRMHDQSGCPFGQAAAVCRLLNLQGTRAYVARVVVINYEHHITANGRCRLVVEAKKAS